MRYFLIFFSCAFFVWPSYFIMTLFMFRQKVNDHVRPIIVSSLLMGHVSLLLQLYPLQIAITLIQPIIYIFCLSYIFKFRLFYSALMGISSYLVGMVTEIGFNVLTTNFKWDAFLEAQQNNVILPAFAVSFVNIAVAYVLYKLRIGFTFVPLQKRLEKMDFKFKKKLNIILMVQFIFLAITCLTLYRFEHLLVINFIIDLLLFVFIIRSLYIKELSDD